MRVLRWGAAICALVAFSLTGCGDDGVADAATDTGGGGDTSVTDTSVTDTSVTDTGGGGDTSVVDTGVGGGPPPGADTDVPFPIDRGDDGPSTPGTYKGLWLRLVDNGAPTVTAVDGVVGVVCIGMSNSTQECSDYIDKLERGTLAGVAAQVQVVDCAVGGNAIESWNDPSNDARLWDRCVGMVLPREGLRVDQVRVIYHKAADQFNDSSTFYPDPGSDYFSFYDNLGTFAARVTGSFPDVQAVYTTSRMYGGFSDRAQRGEPRSYEEGLALNEWLRENASVDGVWYGWGPYIWGPDCASGETNLSGVCYELSDFQMDAVHPARGALDKVSQMIHDRFLRESWYAE